MDKSSTSPITETLKSVNLTASGISSELTQSVYLDDSMELNGETTLTQSYDFTDEPQNTLTFDYNDINNELSKFKLRLSGLNKVQEGDKVWIENNILTLDHLDNYSVSIFQSVNRYWNNQGREPLFSYIDTQFSEFVKLLDLCKSAQEYNNSDVIIIKVNQNIEQFIDEIIPGLHNLKKTYKDEKKLVAKIESIILTFIDYKDFLEKERRQKENREKHRNIQIIKTSNNPQTDSNKRNNIFVNYQKNQYTSQRKMSF